MTTLSHVVMEYAEPMISAATGETVRPGAWHASACFYSQASGQKAAIGWAMAGVNDRGYGLERIVLTLPYDEASLLSDHHWISQREMDLLISLSDEMCAV